MEIMSTANHLFDKCYLDIVGLLPPSTTGKSYILTFQDDLSRYVLATLISQQDAETVARVFVSEVVLKYGTPSTVHTDRGANFVSEVFKNTCKLLKIKKIQSTAFHLESQGSIERSHRVLAKYLGHYVEDQTGMNGCPLPPMHLTPLSILPLGTLPLNWCLDTPPPYRLL
jgi:transposase InsO family protein